VVAQLPQGQFVLVADVLHGPHSVIAVLYDADSSIIAEVVSFEVRRIDGVDDMTVYLALDDH